MRQHITEVYGEAPIGFMIEGDNLEVMAELSSPNSLINLPDPAKLIYMDPPFFTNTNFKAHCYLPRELRDVLKLSKLKLNVGFSDKWQGETLQQRLQSYLSFLRARLTTSLQLLRDDGFLAIHLDYRVVHHVKVMLDEILGMENFRNEVIWFYGGRGAKHAARQLPRNHDVILIYSKLPRTPMNKLFLERKLSADEARRRGYRRDSNGRWYRTAPRGDYTDESLKILDSQGKLIVTKANTYRVKYYLEGDDDIVLERKPLGDVWDDIPDMMHTSKAQRTGYPTQKPEELLERLIRLLTDEGDLVLDPFCGVATTAVAATKLNRRWICIDRNRYAIHLASRRLLRIGASFKVIYNTPPLAKPRVSLRGGKLLYVPDLRLLHLADMEALRSLLEVRSELAKYLIDLISKVKISQDGTERTALKLFDVIGGEAIIGEEEGRHHDSWDYESISV